MNGRSLVQTAAAVQKGIVGVQCYWLITDGSLFVLLNRCEIDIVSVIPVRLLYGSFNRFFQ